MSKSTLYTHAQATEFAPDDNAGRSPLHPPRLTTPADGGEAEREGFNTNPWVIVTNPGTDEEDIWGDFPTYRAAVAALAEAEDGADVVRRLDDGTLTTEF